MPLRALNSRSLTDQVFDQLAAEIMAERYPAGTNLPSERALTEVFGVNRQVVREALKRLEQLKLVRIAHGGATRVLDFKRHARLDLLALMAEHATGSGEVARYQLAVLEMRAAIGVDIVRLCAIRADDAIRRDLVTLAGEMRAAAEPEKLFALEVRFWERLLDGADNIAYRLGVNTLVDGAYVMGEQAQAWFIEEIRASDYRMPIAQAIVARDPDRAEAVARKIMRTAVESFAVSIGRPIVPAPAPAAAPTKARATRARR
ncbi:MAG TPA: GntR family transcriptional regulator [Polyangiaceae bacterium]|jgi:DNA-binding FadR family transcriptional regulator|nr:GntR family transcriptional regulator [Polyangiaceae bacterium]